MLIDRRKYSHSDVGSTDSNGSSDGGNNDKSGSTSWGQGSGTQWQGQGQAWGGGAEGVSSSNGSPAPTNQPQPQTNAVATGAPPTLPAGWTRIDDTSSYITYSSGQWMTDHNGDTATPKYLNSTFHSSTASSAWMQFAWRGRDIIIYGAKRGNHGLYAVALDDFPVQYLRGTASNPELFQTPLYQSQGLTNELHSILVVNENAYNATSGLAAGQIWLDVDFIDFHGEAPDSATYANEDQQAQMKTAQSSTPLGVPPTTISNLPTSSISSITKLAALSVSHGEAVVTITASLPPSGVIPNSRPSGAATLSHGRMDNGLPLLFLLYIPVFWTLRR